MLRRKPSRLELKVDDMKEWDELQKVKEVQKESPQDRMKLSTEERIGLPPK